MSSNDGAMEFDRVTKHSFSQPASRPWWQQPRFVRTTTLGLILAAVTTIVIWQYQRHRHDRAALAQLMVDQRLARHNGALEAAGEKTPHADELMATRLLADTEPDPALREVYVYALGRSEQPNHFDVIAHVIKTDNAPAVRHAAWIAAARLDPVRFRAFAEESPPPTAPWDEIGRAFAWLEVGDTRGVDTLFEWALEGTPRQQSVAGVALYRGIGPLLESAGCWPIDAGIAPDKDWTDAQVRLVRRRAARLNLQAIANDTMTHIRRSRPVHKKMGRLYSTRDRIARLLSRIGGD